MSQAIDVQQWLNDNQLSDVLQIFIKRQIAIEELIEFDITDLQDFANEIGLDTLQKNRFLKGIKKLKCFNNNDNNNDNNNVIDSIQNNYYEETTKLIEALQGSFKNVDESIIFCKNNINNKFNQLFEKLKLKQTKLLKEIDENGKNKKNEIAKQLQIMIDARIQMKHLEYKQIKQFKSMTASSINYKIKYQYNQNAENNLLSSMKIKSFGIPPGCLIIIDQNNVTSNSIKISWAINSESAVSEYEIQYAKFRKIGIKKKNVKKKNKKQNKKKKKKYDCSSSDDDDDDDDDSDSNSSHLSSSNDTDSDDTDSNDTDSESDDGERYDDDNKEREEIEMAVIDVKQLKFKSVKFKNTDKILKRNYYKLNKLNRGYCYIVRMRSKNELGWSDWSESVKIITNNDNKWQFQENNWIWKDFDSFIAKKIQNAYDKGKKKYSFNIANIGQSYIINFKLMEQTNIKTRKVRKIRIVNQ